MSSEDPTSNDEPFRLVPDETPPIDKQELELRRALARPQDPASERRMDPEDLLGVDLPGTVEEDGAYGIDHDVAPAPRDEDIPMPGEDWKRARRGRIAEDMNCISCGYNLRGLKRSQRCPECGVRVLMSTAGEGLSHAAPDWLRAIQFGLGTMLWSIALQLASIFGPDGFRAAFSISAASLALLGAIFFTAQEPRMARTEGVASARSIARGMALLYCLSAGAVAVAVIMNWAAPFNIAIGACLILFVGLMISMSTYFKTLSRRMEDVELERNTTSVLIGLVVSVSMMVIGITLGFVLSSASIGPAACIAVIGQILLVIYGLLFLRLLYRYYGVVRWAAIEARHQAEK